MYTYLRLTEDLTYLSYHGVDVGSIGLSELKNSIPYIHVGEYTGAQIIITAGIHARENVTSLLVMRQAFRAALTPLKIEGGIYFVPMVNPDGALLVEKGADFLSDYPLSKQDVFSLNTSNSNANQTDKLNKRDFLIDINGSNDFSLYKANINGVDLNNNFDAHFFKGVGQKSFAASQGFCGPFAFSESETKALKNFTLSVAPKITLSYHALGRELYWYFFQQDENLKRDEDIANQLNQVLNYKKVDSDLNSTGGYKDWCIDFLKIPSFTVEIISDAYSHPLKDSDLDEDWEVNKDIPYVLSKIATQL